MQMDVTPADTIRQAECGLTVRQGDVDGLVEALSLLAADPGLAEQMGARGREAFLATHERTPCCDLWSMLIDDLVPAPAPRAPVRVPV